jgi:3-phenylpropionate/cinnamic acid dioxygenase small subunit
MATMTLQNIADRIEIDDLLTRYATALDAKDWDLWASCFTPDAFIDYTSAGGIKGTLPEVRQWLTDVMAGFPMTQHLVTNRAVHLDGDTATCRSCLFNPMGVPDNESLMVFFDGGYYRDRLVRTMGGWRIAERIEEATFSTRLHRVILRPFAV